MELITRDRDRLLQRAARVYGLSFTVVSALCLLVPGVVSPTTLLWAGPLYLLLAFAQWRMGATDAIGWVLLSLVAGSTPRRVPRPFLHCCTSAPPPSPRSAWCSPGHRIASRCSWSPSC